MDYEYFPINPGSFHDRKAKGWPKIPLNDLKRDMHNWIDGVCDHIELYESKKGWKFKSMNVYFDSCVLNFDKTPKRDI